jgi:hypothetical protein
MIRARSRRLGIVAIAVTCVTFVSACDLYSYLPGTPRPSWCDPTDTAVNDGHTTAFFNFYTTPKGPLSQSDCQQVASYIQEAADFASKYPTVAAAQAAGWVQATVWTPGQGIHFVDPNRITGPFDPRRPNYLLYNGTAPTSNLAGMMFLTDTGSSTTPPAGFPGNNDHWHNHGPLCYKAGANPYIIGESPQMSNALCTSLGGVMTDFSSQWMVHVWLPVYAGWQATDIFNVDHPSLN